MRIDLRNADQLPESWWSIFNKVALQSIDIYNNKIDELNIYFQTDLNWMFSVGASRSTFLTKSFYRCCILKTLLQVNFSHDDSLVVDNDVMKNEVLKVCLIRNLHPSILIEGSSNKVVSILSKTISIIKSIIIVATPHLLAKFFPTPKLDKEKSITLIDTFVLPNYVEQDRYYCGLLGTLKNAKENLPTFSPCMTGYEGLRQFFSLFLETRKSNRDFIYREDYVSTIPFLRSIVSTTLYCPKIPKINIDQIDLKNLIIDDFREQRGGANPYLAWYNYLFFKGLKKRGAACHTIINWFENQPVDKGWNKGAHTFYPNARIVGYKGFPECDMYVHMPVLKSEFKNKACPNEIATMGVNFKEEINRHSPLCSTSIQPAFRFQYLHDQTRSHSAQNILVCLPMNENVSTYILSRIIHHVSSSKDSFIIKRHPGGPSQQYLKIATNFPQLDHISWSENSFDSEIANSKCLISASSSTCLEAILKGVPVVMVTTSGFNYNYVPKDIPKSFIKMLDPKEDLKISIENLVRKDRINKVPIDLYFKALDLKGCREFISP